MTDLVLYFDTTRIGVEAALMSFYNKSITREQEKFRPPSVSTSSLYNYKETAAAATAAPTVITATALKNLSSESAVVTSSNGNPYLFLSFLLHMCTPPSLTLL